MYSKSSSFGVVQNVSKYGIIPVPPASDSQGCLYALHVDFTGNWQAKLKSEQSILCVTLGQKYCVSFGVQFLGWEGDPPARRPRPDCRFLAPARSPAQFLNLEKKAREGRETPSKSQPQGGANIFRRYVL